MADHWDHHYRRLEKAGFKEEEVTCPKCKGWGPEDWRRCSLCLNAGYVIIRKKIEEE